MKATSSYQISVRSVMRMAWVYARQGAARFGGPPKLYLAAAMRQAWAEEKAAAAQRAAKAARWGRQARLDAQLAALEAERLERMAGRNSAYAAVQSVRGICAGRLTGSRY